MTGALLIDVDSTIPNLALMHISTWRKSLGIETGFNISDPDEVWASCIFRGNRHKLDGLKYMYPGAKIDIGGSGVDLHKHLPEEVDRMMPDYSLYPECDYDLGFTTRGCLRNCYFCIVPGKEGRFHIHQHPSEFHDRSHRSIVLLDNNILADKDWFFEVTDWILKNDMSVDFNQGLDIRLLDMDIARRLKQLRRMKMWRFAFDSMAYKDDVLRGIGMLRAAEVNIRSGCQWYVYCHDDAHVDDALERCRILRENGTLAYIMLNRDAERTQRMTDLKRWTRPPIFFRTDFDDYHRSMRKADPGCDRGEVR